MLGRAESLHSVGRRHDELTCWVYTGDLSHLLSILILLHKMKTSSVRPFHLIPFLPFIH